MSKKDWLRAFADIDKAPGSLPSVARRFNVSLTTMRRRYLARDLWTQKSAAGRPFLLSGAMQKYLEDKMVTLAESGYGVTPSQLRSAMREAAAKNGYPAFKASRSWYRRFMAAHPELITRRAAYLSMARATKFTPGVVSIWHTLYAPLLSTHAKEHIYNMDEVYVNGEELIPRHVICAKKSDGAPDVILSKKPPHYAWMAAGNAAGMFAALFFVFSKLGNTRLRMNRGAPGSDWFLTESGWAKEDAWIAFAQFFVKHIRVTKAIGLAVSVLLIVDDATFHSSPTAILLLAEANIKLLCLPAGCTHKMQPFDVGVFAAFRAKLTARNRALPMVGKWEVNVMCFTHKIVQEWEHMLATTGKNPLTSGFARTGLYPLNPHIFTAADFAPAAMQHGPPATGPATEAAREARKTALAAATVAAVAALTPQTLAKAKKFADTSVLGPVGLKYLSGEAALAAYVEKREKKAIDKEGVEARRVARKLRATTKPKGPKRARVAEQAEDAASEEEGAASDPVAATEAYRVALVASNAAALAAEEAEEESAAEDEVEALLAAAKAAKKRALAAQRRAPPGTVLLLPGSTSAIVDTTNVASGSHAGIKRRRSTRRGGAAAGGAGRASNASDDENES